MRGWEWERRVREEGESKRRGEGGREIKGEGREGKVKGGRGR